MTWTTRMPLAATLIGGLVITGTVLPAGPAAAAISCFDHVSFTARLVTTVGTAASETIHAGTDAVISAQPGNDQVLVRPGVTRVTACLDTGNDLFDQAKDSPSVLSLFSVRGGAGDDGIRGGDGPDHLYGETGNDILVGFAGDDILNASDGDDTIFGGPGRDTIRGGAGDDFIEGGEGDDIIYATAAGVRKIDGGPGVDYCIGVSPYMARVVNCEAFG